MSTRTVLFLLAMAFIALFALFAAACAAFVAYLAGVNPAAALTRGAVAFATTVTLATAFAGLAYTVLHT